MKKLVLAVAACAAVLGAKAENVLPDGYTAVESIQLTGQQRINTQYPLASTDTIEMKVNSSLSLVQSCLWCARGTDTAKDTFTSFLIQDSNKKWRFRYDRVTTKTMVYSSQAIVVNTDYTIVANGDSLKCTLNDADSGTMNAGDFTVGGPVALFASYVMKSGKPDSWANYAAYRFFSFKVWNASGDLQVDMVPAKRTEDGVVGIYDLQRSRFFESEGSAPFSQDVQALAIDVPKGVSETYACDALVSKLAVAEDASAALMGPHTYQMAASLVPSFGKNGTIALTNATLTRTGAGAFNLNSVGSRLLLNASTLSVSGSGDNRVIFGDSAEDAEIEVVNGSTFSMTGSNDSYYYLAGKRTKTRVVDSSFTAFGSSNCHVGRGFKFYKAYDCEFALTNSTLSVPCIMFGCAPNKDSKYKDANYHGRAERNVMRLHNAKVSLYDNGKKEWAVGFGNATGGYANDSFTNTLVVSSDRKTSNNLKGLYMGGVNDTFRLEGDVTVSLDGWSSEHANVYNTGNLIEVNDSATFTSGGVNVYGSRNTVRVNGGTLGGNVMVKGGTNRIEVCGGTCSSAVSVSVTAVDASVKMTSGKISGTFTPGPKGTTYEITGGQMPTLSFTDGDREFIVSNYQLAAEQTLSMSGSNHVYEVFGTSSITGNITIAGINNKVILHKGATHRNVYNSLKFTAGGVNNTLVIDDTTYDHAGPLMASYISQGHGGFNYTGLTNCAIEVRGKAPKFVITSRKFSSGTAYGGWYTGTQAKPVKDNSELRFRCVIPKDGWAEAPFQVNVGEGPTQGPFMLSNTVFEVVFDEDLKNARHGHMKVPLWKSQQDFSSLADGSQGITTSWCGIDALNQTAQTLGTLPEGVKLTYDSSKRTIYADIKGNCGLFIVVK